MGLAKEIDLKPLTEAYLFANTPIYLFRRFRENSSLRELAKHTTVEELTTEYINRTTKAEKSIEDVVVAYSLLIAITFLEYDKAVATFESIDLSRLDWGEEIKHIFRETMPVVNYFSASITPEVNPNSITKSDGSANYLEVDLSNYRAPI